MASASALQRRLQGIHRKLANRLERRVAAPLRALRNSAHEYDPVFVAGASGGGTSVMALSLAQRFECAGVVNELDIQVSPRSFLSVPRLSSFSSLAEYEAVVRPRADWSPERGRVDLQNTFRAYCDGPGGLVFVKGPDINLIRASFLARCFPDAPFVMIFRDPAANLEGYRRKWRVFGEAPLAAVIRFYRELYESFLETAESLEKRLVAVEYEKLVSDPDSVMDEIGRRLGLAPARSVRRYDARENVAGKGIRNVRDGVIEIVPDASQASLERLSPAEAARIREALGPLHERLRALPCLV